MADLNDDEFKVDVNVGQVDRPFDLLADLHVAVKRGSSKNVAIKGDN